MQTRCTPWTRAPRATAADTCLVAIGDVHGHADELEVLLETVMAAMRRSPARRKVLVFLGDYVDRGPRIRHAIDLLVAQAAITGDGIERVFLAGNHDQFVFELLDPGPLTDRRFVATWLENGGQTTLAQLGVEGWGRLLDAGDVVGLSQRLRERLGDIACRWLENLRLVHRDGAYVFVHAGVAPTLPLDRQDMADLLLMREPFLSCAHWRHDFCVVHGHTIAMPRVLPHRIGVDAGCFLHGALCAVQIEGDRLRFVGATARPGFAWNDVLPGVEREWRWQALERV